jgi:hypothetical protein
LTDEERISRGLRAFGELEEVGAAFDAVRDALVKTLSETPVGQDVKVLKLHMALQNLAAVKQALRDVIDNGQMAQHAVAAAGLTRN